MAEPAKIHTNINDEKNSAAQQEKNNQESPHISSVDPGFSDQFDPLLSCLQIITKLNNKPISIETIKAGLPLVKNQLTPNLFIRSAKRIGYSARLIQRPLEELSEFVLPVVLLLKDNLACVLIHTDHQNNIATVIQPESGDGEKKLSLSDLAEQYTGYTFFIQQSHQFDERSPEVFKLKSKHWFWGTLFQSWRIYRDVLLASFLINIFALASPLFVMNVYDRVVPNHALETLWVLAIGIGIVYGFDLLMRSLRGYFIDIAGQKADILISATIFEKILNIKMAHRPQSVGAFANNVGEFESVRNFITSSTLTTLIDLPFVLLFILIIGLIGGPIALIPITAIIITVTYGLLIQGPLRKAVEHTFRANSQKQATLVESLTNLETIKAIGAESIVQSKWEKTAGFLARWSIRSRLLTNSATNLAVFLQQIAYVSVVILGVYLITEGDLSLGGLIACVILVGRAIAPMAQVAGLATQYHHARAAINSINQMMALPVERPQGKQFIEKPDINGTIEFKAVNFSYPGETTEALKDISFQIKPGEKVGIIGRIGSGKTTIEKLILNLHQPSKGSIFIDDVDIAQLDPAVLRRHIGYVPQDLSLFFGSVRENITYAAPAVDDQILLKSAEIAGVTDFVKRHPNGFDMNVGERGEHLSGGQRQSIAIARSLILNPPILILDEPTNAMDNTSEELFKKRIGDYLADKTLVLVTHKASLLELVDRVIVIDNGVIRADGPKANVIEALKQGKIKSS